MTKFNQEFKVKIIKERVSGKSFATIAKRFNVGESTVKTWFSRYEAGYNERFDMRK